MRYKAVGQKLLSFALSAMLAFSPLAALGEEVEVTGEEDLSQSLEVGDEDSSGYDTDVENIDQGDETDSVVTEVEESPEDETAASSIAEEEVDLGETALEDDEWLLDEAEGSDSEADAVEPQPVADEGEEDLLTLMEVEDTTDELPSDEAITPTPQKSESKKSVKATKTPKLWARGRVQGSGLGTAVTAAAGKSAVLGKAGKKLALEQLQLKLNDLEGGVSVRARVTGSGWGAWSAEGKAGAKGARIEGLRVKLTGKAASTHRVYYRVYVSGSGWMGWAKDGALAGTGGKSLAIQALEVRLVAKGSKAPSGGGAAWRDAGFVARAHVQSIGWQKAKSGYSYTLGTTGRSLRLEALKVSRPATDVSGTVRVRAYVQGSGWQAERTSGKVAGTTGKSLRLEAVRIRLTGTLEKTYDVYYRVHVQGIGWLAWTKNGKSAGTQGLSFRVEALQVAYVKKGGKAPSATGQNYAQPYVKRKSVSGDAALDRILTTILVTKTGSGKGALRKAYLYMVRNYRYKTGSVPAPATSFPEISFAKEMYNNKEGNCYRSSSLMTWICRALGYKDVKTVSGWIATASGRSVHSWTEIKIDGKTYILDPNLERAYQRDFYLRTYANSPAIFYKA